MVGREAISEPYQYQLTLVSDDDSVAFEDLLGTDMTVEVDVLGDEKRYFHGLVSHFSYVGTEGTSSRYEAVLRPWLWFLSRSADCRIFQELTAPEIVKEIFAKYPNAEFEDRLGETYAKRTYCVQYRESDLNFVSRLLEDEGICYFFVHEDGKHTLVLADGPNGHETFAGYEEVPYFPPDELARRERDHVFDWDATADVRSGSYTHRSFDFEKPRADLEATRCSRWRTRWPRARSTTTRGRTPRSARASGRPGCGSRSRWPSTSASTARAPPPGSTAGNRFTLARYPRKDQNVQYLLLEVEHEIWDRPTAPAVEAARSEPYRCRFEVHAGRPCRSARAA